MPSRLRALTVAPALLPALVLAGAAMATMAPGTCVEDLALDTDHDAGTVDLSWGAVQGAAVYFIQRAVDDDNFATIAMVPAPNTTYHDAPPEGIVKYRMAVDGEPGSECPVQETHIGGQQPFPDPVCATGLEAKANSDRSITLTWDPVQGAQFYDVLRAEGSGPTVPLLVVSPSPTEFRDENLTLGTLYTYQVHANGITLDCEEASATAIPFLHEPWAGALLGGGIAAGAFVLMRRRA